MLGLLQGIFIVEVLPQVEPAHHILGLHPPVQVVVHMTGVEVSLVDHRAVGAQALGRCLCHHAHDRLHLGQHLLVAQHEGSLMHEPRALDVVAVALQTARTARPVHLKEEVEVMGLGVQNLVGEDADDVAKRSLYPVHRLRRHRDVNRQHRAQHRHIVARGRCPQLLQTAIQVGVWLDDVQVGVLRFGEVGIELRQAHIGNGLPVAGHGLDIAVVFCVEGMLLNAVEQLQGTLQSLPVASGTGILRHAVEGKADGIELLAGVQRHPLVVHAPVDTAILLVNEVLDEVLLGTGSHFKVFTNLLLLVTCLLPLQHPIGCRERPEDAGIENGSLFGLGVQHTRAVHTSVESAMLAVYHLVHPEGQDVRGEHLLHLSFQSLYALVHFLIG